MNNAAALEQGNEAEGPGVVFSEDVASSPHAGSRHSSAASLDSQEELDQLRKEVLELQAEFQTLAAENQILSGDHQVATVEYEGLEVKVKEVESEEARLRQHSKDCLSPKSGATNASGSVDYDEELDEEDCDEVMKVVSHRSIKSTRSIQTRHSQISHRDYHMDVKVMRGSALSKAWYVEYSIYFLGLAGLVFVLVAKGRKLGGTVHFESSSASSDDGHHRLLSAVSAVMPSLLMTDMMYSVAAAGLLAFLVNLAKQPLILGYLLGGVVIGPYMGLDIIHDHTEMAELSSLGLIFLLFMIGLELDVSELFKMGKVVILTGALQFPICAGTMFAIFKGFESLGVTFGSGEHSTMYVGVTCGISSTMIVVKLLSEKAEMDSSPGRLTVGILIFQDIWAIIVLAIQPDLANIQVWGLVKTFAMIALLIVVALTYAKYVIPAVFVKASASVELMLIISLAWCFFIAALATLPFIGLSAELASLIAGVALATFPYSAEFNGKIKYIRDFFITLFFVGLGMQIPVPTFSAVAKAMLVACVVLIIRWLGIFLIVWVLGGGRRLAGMATINLSQISEFALVICSLGMNLGHVDEETLTILIWTFSMLAVLSSYMIGYNYQLFGLIGRTLNSCCGRKHSTPHVGSEQEEGDDHPDRDILLLGFNKIAAMLVMHFEHQSPHLLEKLHVIAARNLSSIAPELDKRHVAYSYGDIGQADVLEHAFHGEPRLVISSIPDSVLRAGLTNLRILQVAKKVWPNAHVIVSADSPNQAIRLYAAGADYVLRTAKLCAERLYDLVTEHTSQLVHRSHPDEEMVRSVFMRYKTKEQDHHHDHIQT